jgi:ubiquinone/menaquinone biosynthesis C-methylase UbiE
VPHTSAPGSLGQSCPQHDGSPLSSSAGVGSAQAASAIAATTPKRDIQVRVFAREDGMRAGDCIGHACAIRPAVSRLDNRTYYDDFASWYERERGHGYHRMLDDLEVELVRRYGEGKDVLEVGCGTGLILARAAEFARSARGLDLSGGMLEKAAARGLDVVQGSATSLPFADASVDVAYSFKVLAHVEDIRTAMSEMARVVRPGGWVLAEFYNARSLRRLVKALKPPTAVSETAHDEHVFTRYDDAAAIRSYLPAELDWVATRGIRVITPIARLLEVPLLGGAIRWAEHRLADLPGARSAGGFLVACCRRR